MRLPLAVALLLALPAAAADVYVGTLASSGASVNNTTTATPFELGSSQSYAVQCDAAAYVVAGTTATAQQGVLLAAGQLYDVFLSAPPVRLAVIAADGSANCRVFRFSPPPASR